MKTQTNYKPVDAEELTDFLDRYPEFTQFAEEDYYFDIKSAREYADKKYYDDIPVWNTLMITFHNFSEQ